MLKSQYTQPRLVPLKTLMMKLCIVFILIGLFKSISYGISINLYSFAAVNCRLAWTLQNCLSDDRPICVMHEDCSYTLYNKCILEFHKQITINEKKPRK